MPGAARILQEEAMRRARAAPRCYELRAASFVMIDNANTMLPAAESRTKIQNADNFRLTRMSLTRASMQIDNLKETCSSTARP